MFCKPLEQEFVLSSVEAYLRAWVHRKIGKPSALKATLIHPEKPMMLKEELQVQNAVPRRRAEYAAGRYCCRSLLQELGVEPVAILTGSRGEPLWPAKVVGSISHDADLAIAVVSRDPGIRSLGIDILSIDNVLQNNAIELIASCTEIDCINKIIRDDSDKFLKQYPLAGALLVFSAKESAIKTLSPLIDDYLDFREIELICDHGQLKAEFQDPRISIDIHWCVVQGFICTLSFVGPGAANEIGRASVSDQSQPEKSLVRVART